MVTGYMFVVDTILTITGTVCDDSQQELEENASYDKETKLEDEQEQQHEISQNPLAQGEPTNSNQLDGEEQQVIKTPHDADLHSDHRYWKQDERMVLEAGSKAAKIAKSVFGK